MKLSKFKGDLNHIKDHDWLTIIKSVFEVTPCFEEGKVVCDTQMFRGLAAT